MTGNHPAITAIRHAADWITAQRWYGNKARQWAEITPAELVETTMDGRQLILVIARFAFATGRPVDFFIPLLRGGDEQSPYGPDFADAFEDPAFLAWWLRGFADGRQLDGDSHWTWRAIGDFPSLDSFDWSNVRLNRSATQSNTVVLYGQDFIGKTFRRLEPGLNPDLEISEFLSQGGRFAHAPRLFGVVERRTGDEITEIAAIMQFVPNDGPGFDWVVDQLLAGTSLHDGSLVTALGLLGERTGQLHVALASDAGHADFAPEPLTDDDIRAFEARVAVEAEESLGALAGHMTDAELEALRDGTLRLLDQAEALRGTVKTRVHGDYHLGQILVTVDHDFSIIDFEGEPLATIDQRRRKMIPLKDVAGVVRSIDYAGAAAMQHLDNAGRDAVAGWIPQATRAFVDGYRAVARTAPRPIIPADDAAFQRALDIMVCEKALYEVRYEVNNRPDWLWIPLQAMRRLAAANSGTLDADAS